MWQYLAEITKTLTEVAEYGRSDPVSTKLLLKRPPGKRYIHYIVLYSSLSVAIDCPYTILVVFLFDQK